MIRGAGVWGELPRLSLDEHPAESSFYRNVERKLFERPDAC